MKQWIALLLSAVLLTGGVCLAQTVNEPDMAAYASCVNRLGVEFKVPCILWDCSVHVNRAALSVNYPAYIDAIMTCYPAGKAPGNGGDSDVFEEETARQAADAFGPGFNLGNTLDTTSFNIDQDKRGESGWIVLWGKKDSDGRPLPEAWETGWGQPLTTEAIADLIVSLGFGTVRIPVTWAEHIGPDDRIDPLWLARVKEVADLFYQRGVYCIINMHHDGGADGWLEADKESFSAYSGRFAACWDQIARAFEPYDERLLFESMNEVISKNNSWGAPTADASRWINEWNQLFVDTVRATGGNNARRNLIVMTYAGGGAEENFASFVLPKDTARDHLMITVHNYDPQGFTWTTATWTKMTARWDEKTFGALLRREFEVYRKYADKFGVPVVLGEYNADPKNYKDYD